jgi:toxin-antitoxin system PIN domain toxin
VLLDANLLIYAYSATMPQHAAARSWLDAQLNGNTPVAMPWESLTAFLRVVTNPRIFSSPVRTEDAWQQVECWLSNPLVWVPVATERHAAILGSLLAATPVSANLVHDAHLAALALEHGLALYSTDGDFARFAVLRWENPL